MTECCLKQGVCVMAVGQLPRIPGLSSAVVEHGRPLSPRQRRGPPLALFHCPTGKYRTGWAPPSLRLLLGDSEDLAADRLLTDDARLPALQPIVDQFAAIGGDPEFVHPS